MLLKTGLWARSKVCSEVKKTNSEVDGFISKIGTALLHVIYDSAGWKAHAA
jgi:hypothetical protein